MSAALAATILRNRPAIRARLTHTVHYRTGGKRNGGTPRTVTGYGADCVVIELDDDGGTIEPVAGVVGGRKLQGGTRWNLSRRW